MLQKCSMIGLTADAVSVGQDHILNVFLWNPDKNASSRVLNLSDQHTF